jgi:hypothetical protein
MGHPNRCSAVEIICSYFVLDAMIGICQAGVALINAGATRH